MIQRICLTVIVSFILILKGYPQKIITLYDCYDAAMKKSSLAGEQELHTSIWQIKDKNLSKNWLPSLDAGASFIYNSEVIDLGEKFSTVPIPGLADAIKPLPHEQYRITVDITQTIYDGGATKAARELENTNRKVNEKQTETDLYKLRSQVNNYYFSILMLDRQKESFEGFREVIEKRIASMESALKNEIIVPSDIDIMKAEKIKIEQQLKEIEIKKTALLKILSDLTGIAVEPADQLAVPELPGETDIELMRPELQYFDIRKEQLQAGIKTIATRRMPKAYGFATLGYGNPPGNNFLKDEFAPYYIIGAGIKWNIFDWSRVKNEKEILTLEQNIIEKRKTDLEENLRRMLEAKKAEILSLESLLESDRELIELRKKISSAAISRYENGVITAAEMLGELNAERQAAVTYELHKVSLAMAKAEYFNISGQEIK
ncbi:MAG TPA: TolC family protein [Bacteroidales bacterium]|nr:TolC family protein [Bacteroidales bacterium]HOK75417.1 TolC family protein [Bacteroidales bacterium]HOM40344.1 TolC family protein [Bacteroidales bacterium]HPP92365.1 TolC family protein [Bacteroidales bacterium]HRR15882.1 TolC family protein [Bacteroidales bacterium]